MVQIFASTTVCSISRNAAASSLKISTGRILDASVPALSEGRVTGYAVVARAIARRVVDRLIA